MTEQIIPTASSTDRARQAQVVLALFDNDCLHDKPNDAHYLERSASIMRQSVDPHLPHAMNEVDRPPALPGAGHASRAHLLRVLRYWPQLATE